MSDKATVVNGKAAAAIDEGLAHHNEGRLPEAEAAYRRALSLQPDNPDGLHLLGVIQHQMGNMELAVDLLGRAVAGNPDIADLHSHLGGALMGLGRADDAAAAFHRALALNPDDAETHNNLGNVLVALGKLNDAVTAYKRALALMPDFAEAYNNLGNALKELGRPDDAVAAYESALALNPGFARAHFNLGVALKEQDKPEDAAAAYQRAVALEPGFAGAHNNLGNVFRAMDRFGEAKAAYDQVLKLNHGGPWWNARTYAEGAGGGNAAAPPLAEPPTVSAFKLQDAADQLEYLIGKGLIDPSFERMIEHYRAVLEEIQRSEGPDAVTKLSPEQFGRLGSFYNRVVHYADAPPIDASAINPMLDFKNIEDAYLSSPVSVKTIDDFLTPDALRALRDFCLESTIFFSFSGNRFVSSWLNAGFNCGLLYQMAEELKERLPRMLGGHSLNNMWLYRCRNQSEGVMAHTDDGAVTFNFWITSDDANGMPGHGGLMVYAKNQPHDWDWTRYNTGKTNPDVKQEIDEFLADAETITIPYRENRVVLFHSNLFHGSDRVHFEDGFDNRRMNITMLFGRRDANVNNPN